jgi:hypothetical protein
MTQHLIYLHYAGNLVIDDANALSIILARANNYLNHRYVVGFRILSSSTSKRCEYMIKKRYYSRFEVKGKEFKNKWTSKIKCGRKAVIGVLFEKGNKKFMVYLCAEHFEQFLYNAVKHVKALVSDVYTHMMRLVEENNPLYDADFTGIEYVLVGGRLSEG